MPGRVLPTTAAPRSAPPSWQACSRPGRAGGLGGTSSGPERPRAARLVLGRGSGRGGPDLLLRLHHGRRRPGPRPGQGRRDQAHGLRRQRRHTRPELREAFNGWARANPGSWTARRSTPWPRPPRRGGPATPPDAGASCRPARRTGSPESRRSRGRVRPRRRRPGVGRGTPRQRRLRGRATRTSRRVRRAYQGLHPLMLRLRRDPEDRGLAAVAPGAEAAPQEVTRRADGREAGARVGARFLAGSSNARWRSVLGGDRRAASVSKLCTKQSIR